MVGIADLRKIVRGVIETYAQYKPSNGDVRIEIIIDESQGHYELMHLGWDDTRRIHGAVIHIDLIDDKVWIQHDGTSYGIALELEEAGIPKEQIVPAYKPPSVRELMGYAAA